MIQQDRNSEQDPLLSYDDDDDDDEEVLLRLGLP